MTTLATESGLSEVINARRTESLDAPYIIQLRQSWTDQLFGRVNVVDVIEKAVLAVTLCNANDEIMANASFFDHPNLLHISQTDWEQWMSNFYSNIQCSSLNSLFLHYFVAKKDYTQGCAREIVRTAFNAVPDLHYIFLCIPPGTVIDKALANVFEPLEKPHVTSIENYGEVFICHRHNHVPVLHIRKARVEDHDDLTPIFNRQSDMLKATYGNFFLAELIEAQDEHMQCLVAEVDGTAIGFMSISDDVNFDMLNECFELGTSHGLRKPDPQDIISAQTTPALSPTPLKEETNADVSKRVVEISSRDDVESQVPTIEAGKEEILDDDVKVSPKLSDSNNIGGNSQPLLSGTELTTADLAELGPPSSSGQEPSNATFLPLDLGIAKRFIPTYRGSPNAFSIQLFCIDERYEMRSWDFLPHAFSLFPAMDFCAITLPHMVPEFPLIQSFVRVTPRCPSTLPQELYIFHRAGLVKNFVVRTACSSDFQNVQNLVKTIQLNENLLEDLTQFNLARRDSDGTEIQAFVAECQKQIVGVAIIRREEDIEYIRSHYNIEDFIYFNHHRREDHGHLNHFALNPIFSHLTKHFLKEILRLSYKTCLYYPLYPAYSSKETLKHHSLICALGAMVPVRARRQIKYPLEQLGINAPSERVLVERKPYALNHINRKLTLEPKVTINARIVVVGASDVGLSFLETFAYCPHLRFNNLTLISPHGLPGELPADPLRDQMLPASHSYSQEDFAKVSLRTWVNVVYGRMTAIERKRKIVMVNGSAQVPYDHVVLCTGQQLQAPSPTGVDISTKIINAELPKNPTTRLLTTPPRNLYLLNDAYDAAAVLRKVKDWKKESQKLIVYGLNLGAYCCINALLNAGIEAANIAIVVPPTEEPVFDDSPVEDAVKSALGATGVKVYNDYLLAQWNDQTEVPDEITCASFTGVRDPLRLECQGFFSFVVKGADLSAFKAINDSYLVYDGKLVIDASFHTNDVCIRGAGPLTKFQRKYHADQWTHACFNSKEVGIALATEMLRLFDPTLDLQVAPPPEPLNLIPIYRSPRIVGATLPGGYHYLEVIKPGIPDSPEQHIAQALPSREIFTGEPETGDGYMRVGVNQYQTVDKIICLSMKELPASNLLCLYGVHQRTLNSLLSRYDEGLIKNLYSYFRESWSLAVFHDRFSDFRDEIRELLISTPEGETESLEEKVRRVVDEEVGLSEKQRQFLQEIYQTSGSKRAVETRLLSFMAYNYYHLPMYAKPGMV